MGMSERRHATWNPQTGQYEAPGEPCNAFRSPPRGGYRCWNCGHEWRKHSKESPGEAVTDNDNEQLDNAIDVIARRVMARLVRNYPAAEEWENYPDIGDLDWERVVDRVTFLNGELDPDDDEYNKAYEFLARRASKEWP